VINEYVVVIKVILQAGSRICSWVSDFFVKIQTYGSMSYQLCMIV